MGLEIEATFVEVNKTELRSSLKALGAKLIRPEVLMHRTVFDTGPKSFARVRDEGGRTILTYKKQHDNSITGTEELNVEVKSYEDTVAILKSCGLKFKAVEDTYRESWKLNDTEIDIDTWPWIPSFVEIEGQTPESVRSVANQLGFDMDEAIIGSVDEIYKLYYDVTNDDINFGLSEIKFTDAPNKLARKLRPTPSSPAKTRANPKIS